MSVSVERVHVETDRVRDESLEGSLWRLEISVSQGTCTPRQRGPGNLCVGEGGVDDRGGTGNERCGIERRGDKFRDGPTWTGPLGRIRVRDGPLGTTSGGVTRPE